MVTSGKPENVRALSLPGRVLQVLGDSDLAMCTAVRCSGIIPKRLERRRRIALPPRDRCTICRSVASRRSSGLSALLGSTSCCDADHDPTHRVPVAPPFPADAVPLIKKMAANDRIEHASSACEKHKSAKSLLRGLQERL